MCVWFPGWPLHHPDVRSGETVVVVDDARVAAATTDEIEVGISRREAEGLCPGALFLNRDRAFEARCFEPVVLMLEELMPRVEIVDPGLVFIPIDGALRYYGGVESLVETVEGKLGGLVDEDQGWKVGVAGGPFIAYWAARTASGSHQIVSSDREFLARLDISTLPDAESLVATFRWLGITTLGALAELPREAIASRFGNAGLTAHRLAHGEDRMVNPRSIPPELAVESVFDEPLETIDQAAFASRSLSARLMSGLRKEGIAPHRVTIEVVAKMGAARTRVWRSADPLTEAAVSDRVWWQLRAWMDSGGIPGGVVRLRLDPSDLSDEGRQLTFFSDTAARLEAERALARVQALAGPDSVVVAVEKGGRMPHDRVTWHRWGEQVPIGEDSQIWPGATPAPVPALIPRDDMALDVEWDAGIPVRIRLGSRWEPVINWSGPWRLTGRWWRGEEPVNRYQIITSAGAFLCVVSEGSTYLAGIYD